MQLAMINEQILPLDQLQQVYFDRGLYFGDGVYEVIRSYNGKIFALEDHINRFKRSLAEINIQSVDIEDITRKVKNCFQQADISNAKIYFHITRGSQLRQHDWHADITPNFFLTITELADSPELKTKGVSVSLYPDLRWKRCDIKSLNLLPNVLAHQDATNKGCFEAILVNDQGLITEGSSSTFFAVTDNTLITSSLAENILPSVTRKHILKCARNADMEILEKSLTPDQAKNADELFIAMTTKDIIPITTLDSVQISKGLPGKKTNSLIEEFKKLTT